MTTDQVGEFLAAARPIYVESVAAGSNSFMATIRQMAGKLALLARRIFGDSVVEAKKAEIADALTEWAYQTIDELDLSDRLPIVQRAIRSGLKREAAKRIPRLVDEFFTPKEA